MVSFHIVPVIVYLIVRVISYAFRFKCEALHCRSLHSLRPVGSCPVCRNEQRKPHADDVYTPYRHLLDSTDVRIHRWLQDANRNMYKHIPGAFTLLCF